MVILIVWVALILLGYKINLNLMKKYCKNKDFCGIVMLPQKGNILQFNI